MKTTSTVLGLVAHLALCGAASAQVFNCGSTGERGDQVVTSSNAVWDIPDNGQFHLNSLVVATNATLTFRKQTGGLNPPVYLLSRSNITIHGTIAVDGQDGAALPGMPEGGPGGFAGGARGYVPPAMRAGDGQGPGRGFVNGSGLVGGGSFGSVGGAGANGACSGPLYGNFILLPLVGGSGGAGQNGNSITGIPGQSGGGGGGAILLASDTQITVHGRVQARGGNGYGSSGGGSGGAVRLVAPLVTGGGTLDVKGGPAGGGGYPQYYYNPGGNGRVRVDCSPPATSLTVVGNSGTTVAWTVGRNPVIFPSSAQQLAIIHAAGVEIPEGTNASVWVNLPAGSPPSQLVTLQARNFSGAFTTCLDVTPENGASTRTNFVWNVGANNVATTNITVQIPGSVNTRITAWAEVSF